jgi:5-methylcytosine-specific restriction endonuclease McrA
VKHRGRVLVQLGSDGRAIRIYRHFSQLPADQPVVEWPRISAVRDIRQQVFDRANGKCELCGGRISWETGHMHESHPKGRMINGKYGEVSVENCVAICPQCHLGRGGVHEDHYPQFGLKKD